jgi:Baseplate J-like protein
MTIPVPQLDDRRWKDLVDDAQAYLKGKTEEWTDFSPGDPGIVLVELFAHLTELMIYRLNRVPEKAYLEYLRLLGLALRPPAAAAVELEFRSDKPATAPLPIPRGVRVSVNRVSGGDEPPVFTTDDPASIEVGQQSVKVLAHHCDFVEGELIGTGTGQPAQAVVVGRPPIIAPTGNELDLVVGVEARPDELTERVPARDYDGRPFRIWQEVDSFVKRKDQTVYVADRFTGHVVFAPALHEPDDDPNAPPEPLAAVPTAGREIRAWYRRGGGSAGNLPGGAISVLKDTVPGVRKVTNPDPAMGGRPAEVLEEALIRGPQELHSVERAVTADDYEAIADNTKVANRARAFTKAAIWAHALPGTVEMLLVPHVGEQELSGGRLTPEILHAHETDKAKEQVQLAIDERRPLGTTCEVNWASYKTVRVEATVVVRREENLEAVKRRLEHRLYATISPLRSDRDRSPGWGFGQALRASHVYDILLKEPGVRFVDGAWMFVESAPDTDVRAIARDEFQPQAWYAGAGDTVFRSLNDAASWEPAASFPGETVRRIECHPELPGHVVVVTAVAGGSRLHISLDTGESWDVRPLRIPEFVVNDIAWSMNMQGKAPTLLLASDVGLYVIGLEAGATFFQILVTPQQTRGFYAIAASVAAGARNVAVAAQAGGGVWLSSAGGAPQTFREAKTLANEDIRVLAIQPDVTGTRAFLWAGAAAAGSEDRGKGTWRWELRGSQDPAEGWVPFQRDWKGGSCWGLAFNEGMVHAATHHGGVARLDARRTDSAWTTPDPAKSGLPLRDVTGFVFDELATVAAGPRGLVLAGGAQGVFASKNGALWSSRKETEFTEKVELPSTWLFVSGTHEISVKSEGEPSS